MNLLLDTHIALWAIVGDSRLSSEARALIGDPANSIYFSAASVWEIAIKHAIAKKDMPVSGAEAARLFFESGYIELPVKAMHAAATERLPPLHADPFDRILVAQAHSEPLVLLTRDVKVLAYGGNIRRM